MTAVPPRSRCPAHADESWAICAAPLPAYPAEQCLALSSRSRGSVRTREGADAGRDQLRSRLSSSAYTRSRSALRLLCAEPCALEHSAQSYPSARRRAHQGRLVVQLLAATRPRRHPPRRLAAAPQGTLRAAQTGLASCYSTGERRRVPLARKWRDGPPLRSAVSPTRRPSSLASSFEEAL